MKTTPKNTPTRKDRTKTPPLARKGPRDTPTPRRLGEVVPRGGPPRGSGPAGREEELDREVTAAQLLALFQITHTTLRRWTQAGMPRESRGRYRLLPILIWWRKRHEAAREVRPSLAEYKLERMFYQKELLRIRFEREARALMPADKIRPLLARMVETATARLLDFARRMPPLLDGRPWYECQKILEKETRATLEDLSRWTFITPEPQEAAGGEEGKE